MCKKYQSIVNFKDQSIQSMVDEIENLQLMLSEAMSVQITMSFTELHFENLIKQNEIKHDLELSHANTKLKLLQETLENKNKDLAALNNFK